MYLDFYFREANIDDVEQIQIVRNKVNENKLSNHNQLTDDDCAEYLSIKGKGWVCECNKRIVGFSIADLKENNIWALFVHPEFEGKGIGKRLHDIMLRWYFENITNTVWLSTSPKTRAEEFYRRQGWNECGITNHGEIKFIMNYDEWINRQRRLQSL